MSEGKFLHVKVPLEIYRSFSAYRILNGDNVGEAVKKAIDFYIENSKIKVGDYIPDKNSE